MLLQLIWWLLWLLFLVFSCAWRKKIPSTSLPQCDTRTGFPVRSIMTMNVNWLDGREHKIFYWIICINELQLLKMALSGNHHLNIHQQPLAYIPHTLFRKIVYKNINAIHQLGSDFVVCVLDVARLSQHRRHVQCAPTSKLEISVSQTLNTLNSSFRL